MDAFGSQEFVFSPVVEACGFSALQSTGGLSANDFGMVAVQFSTQQHSDDRAKLWDGDRRRDVFFPVVFPT